MNKNLLITYPGISKRAEFYSPKAVTDLLKIHPEGLMRYPYFLSQADSSVENIDQLFSDIRNGKKEVSGPFTIVHRTRSASDLLFEECDYEGISIGLETDGRKLPELPSRSEIESLLGKEKTFIVVDGRQYRPNTEVFGFQNVYDDTVKTIDGLKLLGVPNDGICLFATPEEICIEVHPLLFGIDVSRELAAKYKSLLIKLTGIKSGDRRWLKTYDKTVLIESSDPNFELLVPGSAHPRLHRPKVSVGQSHFAYGPAAFSDYCGKKRTQEETLKEFKSWLKFIETSFEPSPKLVEAVAELEKSSPDLTKAVTKPSAAGREGGFKPFAEEISLVADEFPLADTVIPSPFQELNKSLGGGFASKSLNVIYGSREEGKASFLLSVALSAVQKYNVLFLSGDMTQKEFGSRILARFKKMTNSDFSAKAGLPGNELNELRKKYSESLSEILKTLSQNLYFRGADSTISSSDVSQITELVKLLPSDRKNLVFIDGISSNYAGSDFFSELKTQALQKDIVFFVSVHTDGLPTQRAHLIEGTDLELLSKCQKHSDAAIVLQSDRTNLQRFLTFAQGKVDPAVAQKIEGSMLKSAGEKRRFDTYSLLRIIHARNGFRQMILYYYQRDLFRFFEGPAMPVSRA
ncbi:MAG: hypothetical protein HQM10_14805 [Candidatus Riflebacteria bacterium]|nr:hypothetical protein [Candidatus Riflebacteria bacterium]